MCNAGDCVQIRLCCEGYTYIVVGLALKHDKLYSKYLI
jgi:hypothetical protein